MKIYYSTPYLDLWISSIINYFYLKSMIGELLFYLAIFALIAGTLWLGYPYISWRNIKKREEEENIWIISSSNKRTFEEHER